MDFFNMWEPLGFDAASLSARFDVPLPLAVHPHDRAGFITQFARAVRARTPDCYIEHRILHRDGSVRWRLARGTLVFDDSGTITSFIGTEVDITQLKQIESDLSLAREAAEAENCAKDEILANVSHEIRTPMNAILGMTELLLDSAPNHQQELLSTVRSAATHLLGIVNDLLDFSKIAGGKLVLAPEHISLRATVADTLRVLAVRADRKGLELLCRVRPGVPDAIEGDARRLRQVLMNLVGNAINFTTHGQVEVDVEARPASAAHRVTLIFRVRDTGIGIALDKQAAIFRPFEQEDASTTRKHGGTGLGLTISAQLATLMGGDITVESTPGRGSTFSFVAAFTRSRRADALAASVAPLDAKVDVAPPSDPARGQRRPKLTPSLRVLVAEDNELSLALLQELSYRSGHHAKFARDGRTALNLALEGGCDLMLLDLHMPKLDGFEVVRRIRQNERGTDRHLPVIALTARSSARDRELCLAAGADEFLSKPIEAARLWAAVSRVTARRARQAPRLAEQPLLDTGAMVRTFDGQQPILEKLRAVLRQTLPDQISTIRKALGDGDFVRLREAAHQLVGTVGAFSSVTSSVASTLEEAAVRQEREICAVLVERVGSLCDALLVAIATVSLAQLMP